MYTLSHAKCSHLLCFMLSDKLAEDVFKKNSFWFSEPPVIRCFQHGQSNPTYYVYYADKHLVLRKKPVSKFLYSFDYFLCR